ncbi:MAG TPA: hypothetical protein PLN21_12760 [Gemmatales bacterium]|nr:hypothetical protein [Gemmatales bacterium]
MIQPIQFPNQYDVIRKDAEQFQKLDSYSKARIMSDLIQTGLHMMAISPNWERNQQIMNDRELQGHLAHSKLFARFGNANATDSYPIK